MLRRRRRRRRRLHARAHGAGGGWRRRGRRHGELQLGHGRLEREAPLVRQAGVQRVPALLQVVRQRHGEVLQVLQPPLALEEQRAVALGACARDGREGAALWAARGEPGGARGPDRRAAPVEAAASAARSRSAACASSCASVTDSCSCCSASGLNMAPAAMFNACAPTARLRKRCPLLPGPARPPMSASLSLSSHTAAHAPACCCLPRAAAAFGPPQRAPSAFWARGRERPTSHCGDQRVQLLPESCVAQPRELVDDGTARRCRGESRRCAGLRARRDSCPRCFQATTSWHRLCWCPFCVLVPPAAARAAHTRTWCARPLSRGALTLKLHISARGAQDGVIPSRRALREGTAAEGRGPRFGGVQCGHREASLLNRLRAGRCFRLHAAGVCS